MANRNTQSNELYLAIEVGENLLYWVLTPNGAAPVQALPNGVSAYRLTRSDLRLMGYRSKNIRRDVKLELQAQAEPSIVQHRGAVYATPAPNCWVDESNGNRAMPGGLVVDALLAKAHVRLPGVIGVLLEGEPTALVLWAITADSGSSLAQVYLNPNPDQVEQRAREVAAKHNIASDVFVAPVDGATLFGLLAERSWKKVYSLDSEWNGYSVSAIRRATALGIGSFAALSLFYAGYQYVQLKQVLGMQRELAQSSAADLQMKEEISTHIIGYARLRSVDVNMGIRASQFVWQPGVMVALQMERGKSTSLTVMHKPDEFEDRETKRVNTQLLEAVIRQSGPPGFSEGRVRLTGAGVGYEIEYSELLNANAGVRP